LLPLGELGLVPLSASGLPGRTGPLRSREEGRPPSVLLAPLNVTDALVSLLRDLTWLFDATVGLTLDHKGKIVLQQAIEASQS
jgi:hypothetical protein